MTIETETRAQLIEKWQTRDNILEATVTGFAHANLDPARANALINLVRNLRMAEDVKNDLAVFATSLKAPVETEDA
jgi:hypothetical protein